MFNKRGLIGLAVCCIASNVAAHTLKDCNATRTFMVAVDYFGGYSQCDATQADDSEATIASHIPASTSNAAWITELAYGYKYDPSFGWYQLTSQQYYSCIADVPYIGTQNESRTETYCAIVDHTHTKEALTTVINSSSSLCNITHGGYRFPVDVIACPNDDIVVEKSYSNSSNGWVCNVLAYNSPGYSVSGDCSNYTVYSTKNYIIN